MIFRVPTFADLLLAAAYFLVATAALALTRFDGGVAFLWLGSALLIPALAGRPRREWGTPTLLCAFASITATGIAGLGWSMAVPFAFINMVEAHVGATMLASRRASRAPLNSLGWLADFIVAVGLVAPAIAGCLAGLMLVDSGRPFLDTFARFFAGHALGNITFIPIVSLLISGTLRRELRSFSRGRAYETAALLLLVAAVTAATFATEGLPLLFLPCGPVVIAIFRGRQVGAALSIVLVAVIGGGLTLAGHGPVQMIDASIGSRLQFFQFYLAAVVLTALPIAADLRNRARLHRELRFSEERHRMLAEHSSDILMHSEIDGRLRYVSPSIRQLGGYEPCDLVGRVPNDFIVADDWARVVTEHQAAIARPGETRNFEYRGLTRGGEERWFETHCKAIVDSVGGIDGVISVVRDISVRKADELRLTIAAMTDPLTGLPNRRAFREAAQAAIANSAGRSAGCIVIIDLDHFKRVNDVHGHDGGDAVLRQFGLQASELLRDGDMVARLGGEEFALLLPGADVEQAIGISQRLRIAIAQMGVPSATGMIRVTMSGGVAELAACNLDQALKNADLALYQAKAGGRDQLALAA